MATWWTLKLLATLGFLAYSLAQLQEINISDDLNVKKAVEFFNMKETTQSVFKAISYLDAGYEQVEEDLEVVSFVIKETVCTKIESYNLTECNVSPSGEVKFCTSYLTEDADFPNIICETVSEMRREKRSGKKSCKNIFCKIKNKLRKARSVADQPMGEDVGYENLPDLIQELSEKMNLINEASDEKNSQDYSPEEISEHIIETFNGHGSARSDADQPMGEDVGYENLPDLIQELSEKMNLINEASDENNSQDYSLEENNEHLKEKFNGSQKDRFTILKDHLGS
ncbi:uncharacterized protein RCH25_025887 [Pelodytes ibericus]